ncbi:MAG: MATE family efflux transporter [Firmicutes bacterium]|nr:MATE family efflux transporter [Bacillota bacterium]
MEQAVTLNKRELNKKLLKIALPISVQGVVSATLTMVDTFMVGMLGETEVAAVGVASQMFMIHFMIAFGLCGGTATFVAQFYGTGDKPNIRKSIGFVITVLMGIGILFFTAVMLYGRQILGFYSHDPAVVDLSYRYIRVCAVAFLMIAIAQPMSMGTKTTQQTRVPMVTSWAVFTINIIVNYVLIFGKFGFPKLGVIGAAIGTVAARACEMSVYLIFVASRRNYFRGSLRSYFGWSREFVMRVIRNAAPTTSNEFLWGLGQTMYVAAFNRIGTTQFAAYEAASAIANIFSFAAFSVGDATLIMVGQKLGEGKKEEAWEISKHLIKVGVIVGAIAGGLIILTARPMSQIFRLTDLGKHYVFWLLVVLGLSNPLSQYNGMQITGNLRGGGDTRFAMIAESSCVWLVAVPMAFLAAVPLHLSIVWAYVLTRMEDVVKFFILTWRWLSKKWLNNVISGL